MVIKSLDMKNRSYYFWDDRVYIKDFDPKKLKLDKKESLLEIDIYYIGYVTKTRIYNINSVNPLYLVIQIVEGYVERLVGHDGRNLFITTANDDYEDISLTPIDSVFSKNIAIPSVDKNKKVLNKLNQVWDGIENKINASLENRNKIRFNSDVALRLNTPRKFYVLTIIVRCVIMKDGKFYPEIYLDDALFEV